MSTVLGNSTDRAEIFPHRVYSPHLNLLRFKLDVDKLNLQNVQTESIHISASSHHQLQMFRKEQHYVQDYED